MRPLLGFCLLLPGAKCVCPVGKVASGGLKCLSLAQCFPVFVPSLPGMPFVEVVLSVPLCTLCL